MILRRFRVKDFRSIEDSGWIETDKITAFIGTNESGKTNILVPLWKLNPANGEKINLVLDLPRTKYHIYYKPDTPKPKFIFAEYYLDDEKFHLSELSGRNVEEFDLVIVSKDFDSKYYWEFPNAQEPEKKSIEELTDSLHSIINSLSNFPKIDEEEKEIFKSCSELIQDPKLDVCQLITNIIKKLTPLKQGKEGSSLSEELESIESRLDIILKEYQRVPLCEDSKIAEYLKNEMPKFVYYSNYGNLDSQIYLPNVIADLARSNLGVKEEAKARTLKTLFKFVNLEPKEIASLGNERIDQPQNETQILAAGENKAKRDILLSSAASSFTESFSQWWKQDEKHIFKFKADGNFFRIWVSDSVRPEEIELEARSTGLQWFFSFYLVFLVESELSHKNSILLLDEPGLTLHPLAQKALFEFFENLSDSNQIMYTTHSPFMVNSNHLEWVRSVFINKMGRTEVSSDLRASEKQKTRNQTQSIFPVHAALGLTVSDTLLINSNPVLVEGESDQLYLSALKILLISKNKISPKKELIFIPTGGVKGIRSTASILRGTEELPPYVVLDGDKIGLSKKKELQSDLYSENLDRVIILNEFAQVDSAEIEDILPFEKYVHYISRFIPHPEDSFEEFENHAQKGTPICNQIEKYANDFGLALGEGWKVHLAKRVKNEILKEVNCIISETDEEFTKIVSLFNRLIN